MLKLQNVQNGQQTIDYLGRSSKAEGRCPAHACIGSVINTSSEAPKSKSKCEIKSQAKELIQHYYEALKEPNSEKHLKRWNDIKSQIENFGTYDLTSDELLFGAKLAWRNVPRCIGRIQWNKLKVFDMRHITTTKEMFAAICHHMKWATEGGKIKIAITVFPNRKPGVGDFKIWNGQIVSYAGYKNCDGTFTGDPRNVEFTEICTKLGWKSKRTNFDVLPLLLSANGEDPEMFEVPEECALRIPITHPKYPALSDLHLEWYASPAISSMMFDCGGVEFPAAPFNGWYIGTEIGCRNFADTYRYNLLEVIAQKIGLDTKNPASLWKDQALVEINFAVLDSFQKHGVTIMDHHTATETFMRHFETENKVRGGCPADWVWLVPPMSGSLTPVFHQEMAMYFLRPCYEYQEPAWRTHSWKNPIFLIRLFRVRLLRRVAVTILYATETGKSAAFAHLLQKTFALCFNPQVYAMDEYSLAQLSNEKMVIVIASTFGNGDSPENGESFYQNLQKLNHLQGKSTSSILRKQSLDSIEISKEIEVSDKGKPKRDSGISLTSDSSTGEDTDAAPLSKVLFSVFALGSTAYPNYCAFGSNVDKLLADLGAERLLNLTCGNELDGQEESFQKWSLDIFTNTCQAFEVDNDKTLSEYVNNSMHNQKADIVVRHMESAKQTMESKTHELSRLHNRDVLKYELLDRRELHEASETYASVQIILQKPPGLDGVNYHAGDHIGIFPENSVDDCTYIYSRLLNKPKRNETVVLEFKYANEEEWRIYDRLPKCSLMEMLKSFVDISTPCRQDTLNYLASCTHDEKEKKILSTLGKDKVEYENWKQWYCPTLTLTLKQFPSVKPDAITLISKLSLLQPRFYSVSSSSLLYPDEIHLTVSVLKYTTQNKTGPLNYGVCSNYINNITVGTSVSCFFRSTPSFRLPEDLTVPLIFVGAGTGIAPLRGLWQDRLYLASNNNMKVGSLDLYFGCRNSKTMLYQDELFEMLQSDELTQVYVAMSKENLMMKTYVQDLLVQNRDRIVRQIMNEGAHIYICGNCTMAEEVLYTIKSLISMAKRLTDVEADNYVAALKSQKRYHVDIFGSSLRVENVNKSSLFAFLDEI